MREPRKPKLSKRPASRPTTAIGDSGAPTTVAKGFDDTLILDALSPESRAVLAQEATPGAPAENLRLAAGDSLFERVRRPAKYRGSEEDDYPNLRETELNAPVLWAEYRGKQAKWRAELEAEIPEKRDVFAAGNLGALLDTLIACSHRDGCLFGRLTGHRDHWIAIPRWALDALTVLVAETIPTIRAAGKGKHSRWLASWKQDQIDYERWRVVKMLREHQVRFTDGEVYEKAASWLQPDDTGGAEAVRSSYRKVQKRMKSQPSRYAPLKYGRVLNRTD